MVAALLKMKTPLLYYDALVFFNAIVAKLHIVKACMQVAHVKVGIV